VAAVVILALGFIGYERYIPIHHVERSRLAELDANQAPPGFKTKPDSSQQVPASSSPFSDLTADAKRSPNSTGAYSIDWEGTKSTSDEANLLVSMLPSSKEATSVLKQAETTYLASGSLKSDGYTQPRPFTVPSVSGARAATFSSTSTTTPGRLSVAAVQVGRYVAVSFVAESGSSDPQAAAVDLMQTEVSHLDRLGQGLSLKTTHWPFVASLVYGSSTIALAALVIAIPLAVAKVRQNRRLARERMLQRSLLARGSKVAKRQAGRRR
jgi:hypothetical protein